MYNNYVSISKTALYTITSIIKKHILITTIINYQTKIKIRNYIKKHLTNKMPFPKPHYFIFQVSESKPYNPKPRVFESNLISLLGPTIF